MISKRRRSAFFVSNRLRNSLNTEKSNPGSVISKLKAYFQSMRVLTASAACLSVNPSAYCITITRARRQADSAGCPFSENKSRKSSSRKNVPNSSRMWIKVFPLGKMARATRAVSSAIGGIACGCNDICSPRCMPCQFLSSSSHFSPDPFANTILVEFYHIVATTKEFRNVDLQLQTQPQEMLAALPIPQQIFQEIQVMLRVVDAPGLGEDIARDPQYIQMYHEHLPKCDAILWIITARNRALALDQQYLREFAEFHPKMAFG